MSNKEITEKFMKAHEGNLNVWEEIYAPDVLVHKPPFPDTRELEANKQASVAFHQGLTDLRVEWEEVISEGNTVAFRLIFRAKHTGASPMLPVPPTGKEIVGKACGMYHVKNKKIVEEFWYMDFLGLFQQLGIMPPMGQK